MRTVRRLYFYSVAFVSVEVVLWGLIGLGRSLICQGNLVPCGSGTSLAEALALTLVGVPFFGFHWWFIQRMAGREMEERSAWLRAFFLYAVLLSTLIPVVQNIIALVNRPALVGLRLSASRAFVGGNQTWGDNLIAILMNLLVAAYFYTILHADWKVVQPADAFTDLRRLYRYIWVLYGLGLTVAGVSFIVRFLLTIDPLWQASDTYRYWGVNGMVMALLGAPLWAFSWLLVQRSISEKAERESLLRLGLLYLLSLAGALTALAAGGVILNAFLGLVLGIPSTLARFVSSLGNPLGICLSFTGIWLYYGRWLNITLKEIPEVPRRAGMRRLYFYILSLSGLAAVFTGLSMLVILLVDLLLSRISLPGAVAAARLSASLATLLIGLPLWLLSWLPMQAEAIASGDVGDHARRSIVRRAYLYLAIFAGVVGGMVAAIGLFTALFRSLLGAAEAGLLRQVLDFLLLILLFVGLGVYHGWRLRRDGRMAASALAEKQAAFSVLLLDPGDGFGAGMEAALQKVAPGIPLLIQPLAQPVESFPNPLAVVLPLDIALAPPVQWRPWLDAFSGIRVVVPRPATGWHLVGMPSRLPFTQAAHAVRLFAEGQEVRSQATPAWQIALYIVAGLISLPILVSLIGSLVSSFLR